MAKVELPPLRQHHVEVELVAQVLPQSQRLLVEQRVAVDHVVGPDDRRVAAGIAAADIPFFDHPDAGDAVLLGKVVGGGQTMTAAADDHDVVSGLGLGIAPGARPAPVLAQRLPDQRQ